MTDRGGKSDRGPIVVIGAGHNGLTCAAYLAREGLPVTVLEARDTVGGAACTREFHPGFRVSAGAHWLHALDPKVERELDLAAHGLDYAARDLYTIALDPGGRWLSLADGALGGPGATAADRVAMARFHRRLQRFAGVLRGLDHRLPPRLGTRDPGDWLELGRLGLALRRLGREDLREFLRVAGSNVHDVLAEYFESGLLRGALSLDATLGAFGGPRSNNTMFHLLNRQNGGRDYDLPRGGMGAVGEALAAAARAAGAEIRLHAPVRRIVLENGRATGVELADGEVLSAGTVVSNADPRTTFLGLLGARHLEAGFAHRVRQIRQRGCVAKLHLALDGLPGFRGLDERQHGRRLLIAPSPEAVERAFDAAKYGEYSAEPVFELSVPTVHDAALAPAGRHVLSANVQWAPHDLKAGWKAGLDDFLEACLAVLEHHAPGLRDRILHAEMRTAADLEQEFGMAGGHWHHAELGLDRFWMLRPVPGWARYATPVQGLWLCGAGTHPGGGVTGTPGRNAARAIAAER